MDKRDEGFEEVKPNNVTFYKVDDYIKGTYIDKYTPKEPDQYGNIKPAYSLKAEEGKIHDADGKEIKIKDGEIWRVWGGKAAIDNAMKQVKMGQKVIVELVELRPTKKGNPAKIMKVKAGPMDDVWLEEKAASGEVNDADFDENF